MAVENQALLYQMAELWFPKTSSATENPSVYIMTHMAGDLAGTMRTPVLAIPGTTYYRDSGAGPYGIPWGNYSTTCIDPSDPHTFWTLQEYANSTTDMQWTTGWVAFQAVPEPIWACSFCQPCFSPAVAGPDRHDNRSWAVVREDGGPASCAGHAACVRRITRSLPGRTVINPREETLRKPC
jgi:hypothetical protein